LDGNLRFCEIELADR